MAMLVITRGYMSGMGCSTAQPPIRWQMTGKSPFAPKEAVQAFAAIRSDGSVVTWGFAYLGLGAQRGQRPNFQGKQHLNCALSFSFGRKVLADQTPSKLVRKVPMQMLVATCCIRPLHPGIPVVSAGIPVFCREKGGEPQPLAGGNSSAVQLELVDVKDPEAVWQGSDS